MFCSVLVVSLVFFLFAEKGGNINTYYHGTPEMYSTEVYSSNSSCVFECLNSAIPKTHQKTCKHL